MFKALILQQFYELSDDQVEIQIRDRLSFMRFLGIQSFSEIPDSKTIWVFQEKLTEKNLVKKLFDLFLKVFEAQGFNAMKGHIIDATIVSAPGQRNSREENQQIKDGKVPEDLEQGGNRH